MNEWERYVERAKREHGDKLDLSEVEAVSLEIRRHFQGARIEVGRYVGTDEPFIRRGRVSITTGWRPALMLMSRVDSRGSSDLLTGKDVLLKVVSA